MWRFLTLCRFVQVACQGFLVREACVGVLVSGAVFLLFPFEDLGCFSGCLMSSAGFQKLFCVIYSVFKCSFDEFVGEKVFSPSYSSAILAPPPNCCFLTCIQVSQEAGKVVRYSHLFKNFPREEPRWRRSRRGRTLHPLQIHQKSI